MVFQPETLSTHPASTTLPAGSRTGDLCRPAGPIHAKFRGCCREFTGNAWLVWRRGDSLDANGQSTGHDPNRFALQPRRRLSLVCRRPATPCPGIKRPTAIQCRYFTVAEAAKKGVGYRYPNTRQEALRDLDLVIRAGESIGLIGPSGSGKTTLVDVLLGLLEPQTGVLEYNGHPLQKTLSEWRRQVAYLPQQVFLIDNSLRCNVALGETASEIEESRLQEALRQARLSELVEQLPQGVNTILGERGVRLSGGQRQRVALARAFYHGRSVLVMDEATSALDNETEKEIVAEIQRLKGQKTMIVIAHRLTTVQHCDRIYRLDKGRIVEAGTPEQILKLVN